MQDSVSVAVSVLNTVQANGDTITTLEALKNVQEFYSRAFEQLQSSFSDFLTKIGIAVATVGVIVAILNIVTPIILNYFNKQFKTNLETKVKDLGNTLSNEFNKQKEELNKQNENFKKSFEDVKGYIEKEKENLMNIKSYCEDAKKEIMDFKEINKVLSVIIEGNTRMENLEKRMNKLEDLLNELKSKN
ncbi:MAG: hypothetical protein LBQ76_02525 [Candidatus Fibromonas sp.]|jgi:uncharacterized membrane protein YgaE (UPF0421/DUF939 family)|nr:hypothetical protein [Candidatus Fibromonas sp.]